MATIAPNMVPRVLDLPAVRDSDTEDFMDIMAAIPTKKGLFNLKTWDTKMAKDTAKAVFMVRIPIFFSFTVSPFRKYRHYIYYTEILVD